jgi:hypothetical protein
MDFARFGRILDEVHDERAVDGRRNSRSGRVRTLE